MKILIVTNHSYMLWQFRRELIQYLTKENEVVLSMPFVGHEEDFQKMGLNCIETPIDRRGINLKTDFALLRRYGKMIRELRPDLVITYSIKPNVYAGMICRKRNIPYCANVQGLGTAFQSKKLAAVATALYRFALRKAKVVFFENQGNADEFQKRKILSNGRIHVLHGAGVNLEYHKPVPYPIPSPDGRLHLLYMGRIMREKGMDQLLEAYERLRSEYSDKIVLDIVGFFEDEYDDYMEKIQQMVEEGSVSFHGFQEDPRPYYAACHAVVLPSWHEGMSNVLLEAAAAGRPLISSDIPGCREALEDGKSGFLCQPKSADSLYEALRRLISLTDEEREKMGQAGRERMERDFDRVNVVEEAVSCLFSQGGQK